MKNYYMLYAVILAFSFISSNCMKLNLSSENSLFSTEVSNRKIDQEIKFIDSLIEKPDGLHELKNKRNCHFRVNNDKVYNIPSGKSSHRKISQQRDNLKDASYAPLRMHFDFTYTLAHERKLLEELILPPVKSFFENALKVKRLSGKLRVPSDLEYCNGNPIADYLKKEGAEADVVVIVTTFRGVNKFQEEHKTEIEDQENKKTTHRKDSILDGIKSLNETLQISDLRSEKAKSVINNALNQYLKDSLIFDKIYQSLNMTDTTEVKPPEGVFGWATFCNQDAYTLRPNIATIQFVSDIKITIRDIIESIWTAIHELTHALGFDSSLFSDYVDSNFNRRPLNETLMIKSKLKGLEKLINFRKDHQKSARDFLDFDIQSFVKNLLIEEKNSTNSTESIEVNGVNVVYNETSNNTLLLENYAVTNKKFRRSESDEVEKSSNDTIVTNITTDHEHISPPADVNDFATITLPLLEEYQTIKFEGNINLNTLSKVIENFSESSKFFIISDTVKQRTRDHFDCDSLEGMELEKYGGAGTAFSHWSKRNLNTDYMIGDSYGEYVVSDITLALLKDSGWYDVVFDKAETTTWGYKKGCEFLNKSCISGKVETDTVTKIVESKTNNILNAKPPKEYEIKGPAKSGYSVVGEFEEFCTTKREEKCSINRNFRGFCSLYEFKNALPKDNQYIKGNPFIGGHNPLGDFCPYVSEWNDYNGESLGSCLTGIRIRENLGESVCENCRCFMSTLIPENVIYDHFNTKSLNYKVRKYIKNIPKRASCIEAKCKTEDNTTKLYLTIDQTEIKCPSNGGYMSIDGFFGSVECPRAEEVCKYLLSAHNESKTSAYNLIVRIKERIMGILIDLVGYLSKQTYTKDVNKIQDFILKKDKSAVNNNKNEGNRKKNNKDLFKKGKIQDYSLKSGFK